MTLRIPELVRGRAAALGPAGDEWLASLPALARAIEADWAIEVGEVIGGGWSVVVAAHTDAGAPAVLKMAPPEGIAQAPSFERELAALRFADSRGYPRVLRADTTRGCLLLERLGRPLTGLGLSVEDQIVVIAETLRDAWRPEPAYPGLKTGAEQAADLVTFISETWAALDRPVPEAVIDRACGYAETRRAALESAELVVIHGDAWPGNVLEDPAEPGRFRLVDPDAMLSEPAHDLAIPLRDWTDELLAAPDSDATLHEWCDRMACAAGVPVEPIWQWAYIERVSTGLFMTKLGESHGTKMLDVARGLRLE